MSRRWDHIAQFVLSFVPHFARPFVVLVRRAVALVQDDKLVEMRVFPSYDGLQDSVELGERSVASHLDLPPDDGCEPRGASP